LNGLYAIIDPSACAGRDPVQIAGAIAAGGCAAMQLRAKQFSDKEFSNLARLLARLCRSAGVVFFINDRPDIALQADADGVHLGQDDMAIAEARHMVGDKLVGISTHTLAQASAAVERGADLIGYGPVYTTRTKLSSNPEVGVKGLGEVCRRWALPVVAIGGITPANLREVMTAKPRLVAAISALCGADDPQTVARIMHQTILGVRARVG